MAELRQDSVTSAPCMTGLARRWNSPGGWREVLALALPLVLSTGAETIQFFVDSVFLMWHSRDAMAAAMQAGLTYFTCACLFIGTVGYTTTFVAQYMGAGRPKRAGAAAWQGIYVALFAGVFMLLLIPASDAVFRWAGHGGELAAMESAYFRIVCAGAPMMLVSAAISSFFSGSGRTRVVMCVQFVYTGVHILLDYALIFGKFGLPEMGITGAACAIVAGSACSTCIYVVLFLGKANRRDFGTLSSLALDLKLLSRLLRYGLPSGLHFMVDIMAFNYFVILMGRIDSMTLAASSMAFRINTFAFMPMIGLGIAVSTLVGQALGGGRPELAQKSAWSALQITLLYMTAIAAGYAFVPDLFMAPFAAQSKPSEYAALRPLAVDLLKFVAVYSIFDAGNIIFGSALKGAGDTRFVLGACLILSWGVMALPSAAAVSFGWGVYAAWSFASIYAFLIALVLMMRFLGGAWKKMRVIEPELAEE